MRYPFPPCRTGLAAHVDQEKRVGMGTNAQLERIHATLDFLRQRFPEAFSRKRGEIRPLKPNILDDIVTELGAEEFRQPVKHALAYYKVRIHYLSKVMSGKWYRDLHGNRCGQIPPEAKASATRKHDNILANNRPPAAARATETTALHT